MRLISLRVSIERPASGPPCRADWPLRTAARGREALPIAQAQYTAAQPARQMQQPLQRQPNKKQTSSTTPPQQNTAKQSSKQTKREQRERRAGEREVAVRRRPARRLGRWAGSGMSKVPLRCDARGCRSAAALPWLLLVDGCRGAAAVPCGALWCRPGQ